MWPLLLVMIGPLVCWVWIAGIVHLTRNPQLRSMRFLLIGLVVVLGLTFAGGSQFYYPFPVLAVIFAVGCIALAERLTSRFRRIGVLALFTLHVLSNIAINLPVIPVDLLGHTFIPRANSGVGDQIGWPHYVKQIDAVTVRARSADPAAVVLTSNYGEAGALDRYSTLPEVLGSQRPQCVVGHGGPAGGHAYGRRGRRTAAAGQAVLRSLRHPRSAGQRRWCRQRRAGHAGRRLHRRTRHLGRSLAPVPAPELIRRRFRPWTQSLNRYGLTGEVVLLR